MRKLISLYTGAGGLDLGFEAAGIESAVALEMDPVAVETLNSNRPWPVIAQDIHEVSSEQILRTGSLKEGEADVLIGGPPCQPFSKSGYWVSGDTRRLDDPRAGTLGAYLRVLRDTLPKTFLLENVPGLAYRSKNEGLELINRTIRKINRERGTDYHLSFAKLNAADFGVPQTRERVFVVGSREGRELVFPASTHSDVNGGQLDPPALKPFMTAWDALGDLSDDDDPELAVRGKWAGLLPSIPEGQNYLWHTERGGGLPLFGWRRRYWSFLLKLSKRRPSWTLQAQPGPAIGPFHWKNRRLSARELCRLQTMPDDYSVHGTIAEVQRQVGNAVPSALAETIARAIRRRLLGDDVDAGSTLIPTRRLPVPGPKKARPVTAEYRHLAGTHDAHPGTGQGYAAQRREKERRGDKKTRDRLPLFAAG